MPPDRRELLQPTSNMRSFMIMGWHSKSQRCPRLGGKMGLHGAVQGPIQKHRPERERYKYVFESNFQPVSFRISTKHSLSIWQTKSMNRSRYANMQAKYLATFIVPNDGIQYQNRWQTQPGKRYRPTTSTVPASAASHAAAPEWLSLPAASSQCSCVTLPPPFS